MSLFRNILVLYICLALALTISGFPTAFNTFIASGGSFNALVEGVIGAFGFGSAENTLSLLALPAILLAFVVGGGASLPVLFAVLAANMLISLFTIPTAIGNFGLPPDIAVVYQAFTIVLQFLFTIGLVDWLRGDLN